MNLVFSAMFILDDFYNRKIIRITPYVTLCVCNFQKNRIKITLNSVLYIVVFSYISPFLNAGLLFWYFGILVFWYTAPNDRMEGKRCLRIMFLK